MAAVCVRTQIVDLLLNLRTAIITQDGELLYQKSDIAKSYLRGWFPIDFVSCLPFGYIPYMTGDSEGGASNKATRMLRMFRLLKLLRLVRIKRCPRNQHLVQQEM